jgi:hypothetical protein
MSKASEFVPVRTIGDATKFALSVFSALSGLLSAELVLDLVGTPILQGRVLGILGGLVFMIVSTYCLFYVWSARVVSNLRGLGREEVTGLMWVRGSLAAPDDPLALLSTASSCDLVGRPLGCRPGRLYAGIPRDLLCRFDGRVDHVLVHR